MNPSLFLPARLLLLLALVFPSVSVGVEIRTPVPTEPPWRQIGSDFSVLPTSVAFGNGRFVAVGDFQNRSGATVFHSDDGESWEARTLYPDGSWLKKVIFTGDRFVAVGAKSDQRALILHSEDGISWNESTLLDRESSGPLISVTHSDTAFLAVGIGGTAFLSEDAQVWRPVTVDENGGDLVGTAFGRGIFLAVGANGTFASEDGETWTKRGVLSPLPTGIAPVIGRDLVFIGDRFFASGDDRGLATSFDGRLWSPALHQTYAVTETEGVLVAAGNLYDSYGSADGGDWVSAFTGGPPFRSIAAGEGKLVAIGFGRFYVKDVLEPRFSVQPSLAGIPVAGGTSVLKVRAVGIGPLAYQWFKDGTPIDGATDPVLQFTDLDFSDSGEYWAEVSSGSVTSTSQTVQVTVRAQLPPNESGWSIQSNREASFIRSAAYGNGWFIGVGNHPFDAVILRSRDGISWAGGHITVPLLRYLEEVFFTGESFIAVGAGVDGARIFHSRDGIVWQEADLDAAPETALASAAYGDGVYVAVGRNAIFRSENGIHWESVPDGEKVLFHKVTYGNNEFLAAGSGGTWASPDGREWRQRGVEEVVGSFVQSIYGRDLAYHEGAYWAADGTSLKVSLDGEIWRQALPSVSAIERADDILVTVGQWETYLGWLDGTRWIREGHQNAPFRALAVGDDRIVAFGRLSGGQTAIRSRIRPPLAGALTPLAGPLVAGETLTLNAHVSGTGPFHYQWFKEGAPIVGATESQFQIDQVGPSDSGAYAVEIRNAAGRTRTEPLDVLVAEEPPLDLLPWTPLFSNHLTQRAQSVAYGAGRFVAVGDRESELAVLFTSVNGMSWSESVVSPVEGWLNQVAFAGDRFVAVGKDRNRPIILYSPNGVAWGRGLVEGDFSGALTDIAFGAGVSIATGEEVVLRSVDGLHWEPVTVGPGGAFYGIAFGPGYFLAVGDAGTFRSEDGLQWTKTSDFGSLASLANVSDNRGLAFLNGRFWAWEGHSGLSQSVDGTVWVHTGLNRVSALVALDGALLAEGATQPRVGTPDGNLWTVAPPSGMDPLLALARGDDRVAAAGMSGFAIRKLAAEPRLVTTPDTLTIMPPAPGLLEPAVATGSVRLKAAAVGKGPLHYQWLKNGQPIPGATGASLLVESGVPTEGDLYTVAVSNSAGSTISWHREVRFEAEPPLDPAGWQRFPVQTDALLNSVAFGNGRFVAVGDHPSEPGSALFTSHDGQQWIGGHSSAAENLRRVIFADDKFIAVGEDAEGRGVVVVSNDGFSWIQGNLPPAATSLESVAFGNGVFVAIGPSTGLRSENGIDWHPAGATGTTVAFGNKRFLAISENFEMTASLNGQTWTQMPPAPAGGNGLHLVVIDDQFWLCSRDGLGLYTTIHGQQWRPRAPWPVLDLAKAAGTLVAVGPGQQIRYGSLDGGIWSDPEPWIGNHPASLAVGNNRIVAVGSTGSTNIRMEEIEPRIAAGWLAEVSIPEGSVLNLTVEAVGTGQDFVYRWFRDGQFLHESTEAQLEIGPLALNDHGSEISVAISNRRGRTLAETVVAIIGVERYEDWLETVGLADAPAETQTPDADPDGSGVPNLLRYALGVSESDAPRDRLPVIGIQTDSADEPTELAVFQFQRRKSARDLSLEIQTSENLHTWHALSEDAAEISVEDHGATETVTLSYPLDQSENLFFRLHVTLVSE